MKLIFIKIGKAFSVLKREGLISGGKRILSAFFALFGRVKPGDVLIVTGGVGDSARYRAHNHAEELRFKGFECSVTVQDNPLLASYADKFSVFIFHRTLYTHLVKKLIDNIKTQQKEIIFETDDLVYDKEFLAHMDYMKNINALEKKLYENGVGGEILADPYVKVCTTTTSFLANKLKEKNKQVFIVPNKLNSKDVETANKVLEQRKEKKTDKNEIKIGYFSGTISHNKDFATITEVLTQIMERFSQTQLYLAGHLDVNHELVKKYKNRIVQLPFVPWEKYFNNVARVDINVAPLEFDNPFCEAKSELKFFEAGILEIPTVAVANQTFREAIEDGVDGFVAKDEKEWVEKLSKLIEDEELRMKMGKEAREKSLKKYTTRDADNEDYYSYLKEKLTRC